MTNDFIKTNNMEHVKRLVKAGDASKIRAALTKLTYERGCSRFAVDVLPSTEFLGRVSHGYAHIYGIDTENKTEYFVRIRFGKDNHDSLNHPEISDKTWKSTEDIEKRYCFLFSAVSPVESKAMARRSARIQCWNRVR